MPFLKRGAAAGLASALVLILGVSTVSASSGATVDSFALDSSWSHEEPTGEVTWFDVTGDVRVVTTADGRSSMTVHQHETQTYLDGAVVMESRSVSMQHALTIGENEFLVHLASRAHWTFGDAEGSLTYVLHIVDGALVVEHRS